MNPGKLMGIWLGYYDVVGCTWNTEVHIQTNPEKKQGNLLDDDLQVNFHILMHSPISIISGWWFQPLWLFPTYGKIKKCSKPPTIYTCSGLIVGWHERDFLRPWQKKLDKSFIMILNRVDHRKHWKNQSAGNQQDFDHIFKAASPLLELVVIWNTSAILIMIPAAP